jgi:hypothetical protein
LGAYRIPLETGLLIPSEKRCYRQLACCMARSKFSGGGQGWSSSNDYLESRAELDSGNLVLL